eukprot:scaffold21921_cov23-Prasinocladus_malaysianus.AAC.1
MPETAWKIAAMAAVKSSGMPSSSLEMACTSSIVVTMAFPCSAIGTQPNYEPGTASGVCSHTRTDRQEHKYMTNT